MNPRPRMGASGGRAVGDASSGRAVAVPGQAGTSASAVAADASSGDRGVRVRQAGGRSGCDSDRGGWREDVVRVSGPSHVTPRRDELPAGPAIAGRDADSPQFMNGLIGTLPASVHG
jgi:hypothetical protein